METETLIQVVGGGIVLWLGKIGIEYLQQRFKLKKFELNAKTELELKKTEQAAKLALTQELRAQRFEQGMMDIFNVQMNMEKLRRLPFIDRVLIVKIANGGNCPKPGSDLYGKAVYASHEDPLKASEIVRNYRKVPLDEMYVHMVVDVSNNKTRPYKIITDEYGECNLKKWYTLEEIKYSEVQWIYTDGLSEAMYIISISTYKDIKEWPKDTDGTEAQFLIQNIRNSFDHFGKQTRQIA